jgi:CheY-like chemotaxis protein
MLSSTIEHLPASERYRVAVADDDEAFLRIFEEVVQEFKQDSKQIELRTALTGSGILKNLWDAFDYDRSLVVCFLDIRMETASAGFDVLAALRNSEAYRLTPIIIMSSSDMYDDIVRSYQSGANAYMYKPMGYRRKFELIRETLLYWTGFVNVPQISIPLHRNPPAVDRKSFERGKGSANWILDRLRQDILVGLLKDLEGGRINGDQIDLGIELERVFVRLNELFQFRGSHFSDESQYFSAQMLDLIKEWRTVRGGSVEAAAKRREIFHELKIARRRLSGSLRTMSIREDITPAFDNLDYLIWDIFSELRNYQSLFPHLSRSLVRFATRIS